MSELIFEWLNVSLFSKFARIRPMDSGEKQKRRTLHLPSQDFPVLNKVKPNFSEVSFITACEYSKFVSVYHFVFNSFVHLETVALTSFRDTNSFLLKTHVWHFLRIDWFLNTGVMVWISRLMWWILYFKLEDAPWGRYLTSNRKTVLYKNIPFEKARFLTPWTLESIHKWRSFNSGLGSASAYNWFMPPGGHLNQNNQPKLFLILFLIVIPETYKNLSKIEGGVFVVNRGWTLEAAGRPRKCWDIKMTSKHWKYESESVEKSKLSLKIDESVAYWVRPIFQILASRPKFVIAITRLIEVGSASNLVFGSFSYRSSSVPNFIKIGGGHLKSL